MLNGYKVTWDYHSISVFHQKENLPTVACNATNIINECLRPYSSDRYPLVRLPIAAPAKKHVSIVLINALLSQTMLQSDCNVSPVSVGSKANFVHFTSGSSDGFFIKRSMTSRELPDIFEMSRTVQAPSGCEKFRHSAIDITSCKLSGRSHQKSRSIVYEKETERRD